MTNQSWIASVSYPKTLDELLARIARHGEASSDLTFFIKQEHSWTAPPWAMPGDLVLFYLTKKVTPRFRMIRKQVLADKRPRRSRSTVAAIEKFLRIDEQLIESYGGTIFAYSTVAGDIEQGEPGSPHFRSRIFARINKPTLFIKPAAFEEFSDLVRINENAITPLDQDVFDKLRDRMARCGRLPKTVALARIGRRGFRYTTSRNWREIAGDPRTRFLDESQIHRYFVDHLLREICDTGSPILEECECKKGGTSVGRADYFVRLGNSWLPVETKLNVRALRPGELKQQLKKYTTVDNAVATQGCHKGKETSRVLLPWCLVLDTHGLYVVKNGRWHTCSASRPFLNRKRLAVLAPTEVCRLIMNTTTRCELQKWDGGRTRKGRTYSVASTE